MVPPGAAARGARLTRAWRSRVKHVKDNAAWLKQANTWPQHHPARVSPELDCKRTDRPSCVYVKKVQVLETVTEGERWLTKI